MLVQFVLGARASRPHHTEIDQIAGETPALPGQTEPVKGVPTDCRETSYLIRA